MTPTRGWDHPGRLPRRRDVQGRGGQAAGRLFTGEQNFFGALFNGETIDFRFPNRIRLPALPRPLRRVRCRSPRVDHGQHCARRHLTGAAQSQRIGRRRLGGPRPATGRDGALRDYRQRANSSLGFEGLIDDVKIWRPNPHRVTGDFTDRIVKSGVADCWVQWGREFRRVLSDLAARDPNASAASPDCSRDIPTNVLALACRQRGSPPGSGPGRRGLQPPWSQGHLAQIRPVLIGLRDALHNRDRSGGQRRIPGVGQRPVFSGSGATHSAARLRRGVHPDVRGEGGLNHGNRTDHREFDRRHQPVPPQHRSNRPDRRWSRCSSPTCAVRSPTELWPRPRSADGLTWEPVTSVLTSDNDMRLTCLRAWALHRPGGALTIGFGDDAGDLYGRCSSTPT